MQNLRVTCFALFLLLTPTAGSFADKGSTPAEAPSVGTEQYPVELEGVLAKPLPFVLQTSDQPVRKDYL